MQLSACLTIRVDSLTLRQPRQMLAHGEAASCDDAEACNTSQISRRRVFATAVQGAATTTQVKELAARGCGSIAGSSRAL